MRCIFNKKISCHKTKKSQWLLCCENQIKHFPPRKMKFHLIGKVMMYAMGQAGRGDNDDSHLKYLLAYWITICNFMVDLESLYPLFCSRDFTIKCASAILLSSLVCWASKDQFIAIERKKEHFITSQYKRFLSKSVFKGRLLASWPVLIIKHWAFACALHLLYKAVSQLRAWGMMDQKMNTSIIISYILCLKQMWEKNDVIWYVWACVVNKPNPITVADCTWLEHLMQPVLGMSRSSFLGPEILTPNPNLNPRTVSPSIFEKKNKR